MIEIFKQGRSELRDEAISNIIKIQAENRKTANRKRKAARAYKNGDLVAIQRTQGGPGLKLRPGFLGPYKIMSALRNDRYLVEKLGETEGPFRMSTAADHMKPWPGWRRPDISWDDVSDEE